MKQPEDVVVRETASAYWTNVSPALWIELTDVPKRLPAELSPPAPLKMTYEEFIDWADEDTLAEWVAKSGAEIRRSDYVLSGQQQTSGYCRLSENNFALVCGKETRRRDTHNSFRIKLQKDGCKPDLLYVTYTSTIIADFWLNIKRLWQDPLPPVLKIAHTLGLV